jgi:GNAT superfamily N-acetyltransferase
MVTSTYVYQRLDHTTVHDYLTLTFAHYRPTLGRASANGPVVAVGARAAHGTPGMEAVGLGLAVLRPETRLAECLSLYVKKEYRRRGIATRLLTEVETALRRHGCHTVQGVYMSDAPSTGALEALLARCHWEPPHPRMLVLRTDYEHIKHAPWLGRRPLPPEYCIAPWSTVSTAERRQLSVSQAATGWIPRDLVPFAHEGTGIDGSPPEPRINLVLRYRGEVVGWLLTHRLRPDTVRFTCSYARRDLQRRLPILAVYAEAIARCRDAGYPYASWTVPSWHAGMSRFARRHLIPYAIDVRESRVTQKCLVSQSTDEAVHISLTDSGHGTYPSWAS